MGCDIHMYVEQRDGDQWVHVPWDGGVDFIGCPITEPFEWRDYGMFGFLADVRNHSEVPPIAQPRGLPEDASAHVRELDDDGSWGHSASWLSIDELAGFDYEQTFEDRRVRRQLPSGVWDGAATAEPGGGRVTTFRDFLGESYFRDLDRLKAMNETRPTRVVFWFDN